jgi:hypothetical protein
MFIEEFIGTLGDLAAILVLLGFACASVYCGVCIFRAGIERRRQLEMRAGLLGKVEEYKKKEDNELEALQKRRAELGRND